MNLQIEIIPERPNAANCYIIYSHDSKKGVLIDPGNDANIILDTIKENDINIEEIIMTHGHGDHMFSLAKIKEEIDAPVSIHKGDFAMLNDGNQNFTTQLFNETVEVEADKTLEDGDIIKIEDGFEFEVIHTPGHTPGGICLKIGNILITGDTLFAGSIGRTDFPGGNFTVIMDSIKNKILTHSDNTMILPGHGEHSTIGKEKKENPFINR